MEVSAAQLRGAYPDVTLAAPEAHLDVRSDDGINGITSYASTGRSASRSGHKAAKNPPLCRIFEISSGEDAWCMTGLD